MAGEQNKRTQAERREETRLKLVQATVSCLDEFGISSVRVTDIVKKAGCTTGSIQYLFGSRDELIVESIEYLFLDTQRYYSDLERSGTLEERLTRLAQLKNRLHTVEPNFRVYVDIVSYSRPRTGLGDTLRATLASAAQRYEEWFLWYLEDLGLEQQRVIEAKDLLMSSLYGRILMGVYRKDSDHFLRIQELMVTLVSNHLRDGA